MSRQHIEKWTCDRCAKVVEVTKNSSGQLVGWAGVTLFCPPESSEPNENYGNGPVGRKHLCNECRRDFRHWFENVLRAVESAS